MRWPSRPPAHVKGAPPRARSGERTLGQPSALAVGALRASDRGAPLDPDHDGDLRQPSPVESHQHPAYLPASSLREQQSSRLHSTSAIALWNLRGHPSRPVEPPTEDTEGARCRAVPGDLRAIHPGLCFRRGCVWVGRKQNPKVAPTYDPGQIVEEAHGACRRSGWSRPRCGHRAELIPRRRSTRRDRGEAHHGEDAG
jgi:hypothetical protein